MGRAGVVFIVLMSCACMRQSPPWKSDALERSARMLQKLDKLEADLHQGQSEIATFGELVERHNRAEQIACKVTDEHVEEIHRLAVAQQQKIEQKRHTKKKAVAMARTAGSGRAFAAR
jgi:leucyl-tRNA synthetase